ncbi:MAG: histidine--tRNA ligase [Clostridiales bacterium]|jgi:histidyl-tRNA synthetase|nr:histidine--tRNA ligase [Clostridiales bacterium]
MIKAPKGTADLFGRTAAAWRQTENVIHRLCLDFCYGEIRTPTFEFTELYRRGVGEGTDVVQKEMFTFDDRGGRSLTLRPEMTAGVARAYVENGMFSLPQPLKLYYIANAFRAERPQAGRMVELHQFGAEFIGSYSAAADAEVIALAHEFLRRLNVKNVELRINSIGCPECRPGYIAALNAFLAVRADRLCPVCRERSTRNPLRVLDCKDENCRRIAAEAPSVLDYLDEGCSAHFDELKSRLGAMGIPFTVDPKIVRGLDYYTRTVFEFVSPDLGGQSTVCGGGRYDGLIAEVGGAPSGACGFGLGLERLLIILEKQGNLPVAKFGADVFVGHVGDAGEIRAQTLTHDLRRRGIRAETDALGRGVKAQIRHADRIGAKYSLFIGENEIATGVVRVKDMLSQCEREVTLGEVHAFITK